MKLFWLLVPLTAALVLLITPPDWADVWVRALIATLSLLGVLIWARRYVLRKEPRSQRLELQLAERTEEAHNTSIALEETLDALKKTRAKLSYANKMASLGQLSAGIAHEIKNPINFVNNFAESSIEIVDELNEEVQKVGGDSEETRKRVSSLAEELVVNSRKIKEHGSRVDRIVQSMLLHSHGKKGEVEDVALNEFVEQYVNLAFHGMRAQVQNFNVTIDRMYDDAINEIPIVRQDISRVLVNLLNNAFQAVNARKDLADGEFEPRVRVQTVKRDMYAEISVEDNGGGVPESLRKKIFDPFFTTKSAGAGTGLGLSLSTEIVVDEHGGKLLYETSEWKGARFVILLPLKKTT